jgi:phage terminase large subunit
MTSNTSDNRPANKGHFKKGDPRINRKGRPRSFDALRKLAQAIAHEEAKDKGQEPLVINGHKATVAEVIMRQWAMSRNPQLQKAFIEVAFGKTPDTVAGEEEEKDAAPLAYMPADVIAPSFLNAYRDIRDRNHTEYLFYGGRGSTKSSFISLATIYLLVNNPGIHALATRQVGNTLRDSVFSQLTWAIGELGLSDKFKKTTSPLEIIYIPTGQRIYFRGADDPLKIKSIKPPFGYIGILWFEELDQYRGPEAVRSIEQSAIRGGDIAYIFKSFNPPRTVANWANKYTKIPKANQYQHYSNYLDVPAEWLGRTFLDEAEHLKAVNPKAYEHEYLGIANGTGGQVFENVVLRKITDEEISQFDRVVWGGDWGYYPDPADFGPVHYDAARRKLYLFGEYRAWKQNNRQLYDGIKAAGYSDDLLLIADSAEPKSVADFREYGATCRGAEKGPDSVKYSIKWLQGLTEIVIDPKRCPYAAEEFLEYEYEQDSDGNYISSYPDKNNHSIDRVRYATNLIWRKRGQ